MLKYDLKGRTTSEFRKLQSQKLLAVFSFRFDAALVPALKENLWPVVDGFVSWDDRAAEGVFSSEGERRKKLIAEAQRLGADWVLGMDPDERLQNDAARRIRACMAKKPAIWGFNIRELYEPDKYRSDGIWNRKQVQRLFPLSGTMAFDYDPLHSQFPPIYPILPVRQSGINIFHLKMIDPRRRLTRRDLYNKLDPNREFQTIGYDYLTDETELELTTIDPKRGYLPAHQETGELWMADLNGATEKEPHRAMTDDADRGLTDGTVQSAAELQKMADALAQRGQFSERADLLASEGKKLLFESRIEELRFQPPLGTTTEETCFQEMGWAQGTASIAWGRDAKPFAPMAAIAIGLGAPAELRKAVASLLSQSESTTVIVVNSGGGDLRALLGELSDKVVAVSLAERVFVGAARNMGVYLSTATWMSFLAGDCVARPGWIAERLAKHREGFAAVSSPVVNSDPDSAVAWAYHLSLYMLRLPDTPEASRIAYGLSLERALIERVGYYDPSLRIMEDTMMKGQIAALCKIGFAEGALTEHKAERRLYRALVEQKKRRRRAVRLSPVMADRSLAPKFGRPWVSLRRAIKLSLVIKYRLLLRVRRGLAPPEKEASFKRGVTLFPLFLLADTLGLLLEFPHELRDRILAQKILAALDEGDLRKVSRYLAKLQDDLRLGQFAARQLAAELASAGMTDAALNVFEQISGIYATSSDVKRLRRAIANGQFAASVADKSNQVA